MGPRAPGTPKKGWNCIGFIRPGASGPRGCGKLDFCKFRNNFFYIFDENMEFHIKKWNSKKFNHSAHLRTLAQTNRFLMVFQDALSIFKVSRPFYQNERNFTIFSISGAQKWLFGPESVFWGPCVKPFINTTFWEVFWRPGTGKVRFGPKKLEISLRNRIFAKKAFFAQKVGISRKGGKLPEMLPFLL